MALLIRHIYIKTKASTLLEVLIASILILVVFTMATLSLNTVLKSTFRQNVIPIINELNKIQYLYEHKKIKNNYATNFNDWEVSIIKQKSTTTYHLILLEASNIKTKKKITRVLYENIN